MAKDKGINIVLETKRKKFAETVIKVCKKRGLPLPHINFDGCEQETGDSLAHCHEGGTMICVSERQLLQQNFDQIEKTAAHEAAHIKEFNHNPSFQREEELSNISSFEPKGGISVSTPGVYKRIEDIDKKYKNKKPTKENKQCYKCNSSKNLHECGHCKNKFCEEHINPILPGRYGGDNLSKFLINHSEHDYKENTHPCPGYVDFLREEKEIEDEKYKVALEEATRKRGKHKSEYAEKPFFEDEYSTPKKSKKVPHYHREYVGKRHWEDEEDVLSGRKDIKEIDGRKKDIHDLAIKRFKEQSRSKKKKATPLILLLFMIGAAIAGFYYYENYYTKGQIVLEELSSPTREPLENPQNEKIEDISFEEYLKYYGDFDNQKGTLIGKLNRVIEGKGSEGVYTEYIVDDFDNKIKLLNINKEQLNLFPKTGTTEDYFLVSGKFKRKYGGLDLEVNLIEELQRETSG